jgi:hypothetical protein
MSVYEEKIKQQLREAKTDLKREPSARTKGYIDALEWCMNNLKENSNPWICNYCGSQLMFYSQLEFTPEIRKQLADQAAIKGTEIFKVQKCENPKCNRTYIFIESTIRDSQSREQK